MIEVLRIVGPLFVIIFLTAFVQRIKPVGEEWERVLNNFVFYVGFPVLIFSVLSETSFSFKEEASIIIANSVLLLSIFAVVVLFGKVFGLTKKMTGTLFVCSAFGNIAYFGVPVLTSVSGESVLKEVSLIIAVYLFWIFTLGIGYLDYSFIKKKENVLQNIGKDFIKNPFIIAVFLGLLFGSLQVQIPLMLRESLDMITASVTPLVLVVMGLFIGSFALGRFSEWIPAFCFSVMTLMLIPAIFYGVIRGIGLDVSLFSASIIEAAMPLAITPFALAHKYNLHKIFIARSIVLSTLLSLISLPFWIWVLH